MNIQITSRKFRAKDELKDFVKEQLLSLEKFNDEILEANVVLSYAHVEGSLKCCDIVLTIPSKTLTVSEESDEFKKAVPAAIEKLVRQLRKIKTKKMAQVK